MTKNIFIVLVMLAAAIGQSGITLAQEPFCLFDSMESGIFESAEKTASGYTLTLDQEIGTITQPINANASFYSAVEAFVASAQNNSPSQKAVFLYKDNALCGFVPIDEDYVYVQGFKKREGRYILSVCTEETDHCYTLRIVPGNGLYDEAEVMLTGMVHKVIFTTFDKSGEILAASIYQE